MKTNFKKIVIVLVIIAIIAGVITYFINKNKKPEYVEYEPQEEISDEQERKTMISLYFVNKTTRNVEPEARMLDVKTLIKDPYTVIINMLIDGPKNENHIGGKEEEQKTIECLVNSLTELTEVNSIKILINGEENAKFKDGEIDFSQNFIRNE